jgi:hypothetical protein
MRRQGQKPSPSRYGRHEDSGQKYTANLPAFLTSMLQVHVIDDRRLVAMYQASVVALCCRCGRRRVPLMGPRRRGPPCAGPHRRSRARAWSPGCGAGAAQPLPALPQHGTTMQVNE